MKVTDELRQKMAAIRTEMRGIIDKPAGEGGMPSAEQQARFDVLKAEITGMESRIANSFFVEESERRAATMATGETGDRRWDDMVAGLSVCRAILAFDPAVDAGREREASAEVQRRTGRKSRGIMLPSEIFIERRAGQMMGTGTAGGYLIGDMTRPDLLIDRLRAASALTALGVTTLDGLVGRTLIPKITGSGTVQWIGEGSEPTETEMTFGQIALSPKTAAAQIAFSRQMLINSNASIEGLVRGDIARQVAEAIDVAGINGAGGLEPTGILNEAGLPTVSLGTDGGPPTVDNFIDLTGTVDTANGLLGNLAWLSNPAVVKTAAKLKDGEGRYLLTELPGKLLGYPLVRTTSCPSTLTKGAGTALSAAIFGDWSSMLLGMWSGLDILANPYSRAGQGAVLVHAFQDVDTQVRHIASFAAHNDVVTT